MFKLLYSFTIGLILFAIHTNNKPLLITTPVLILIITAWLIDKTELTTLKDKINQLNHNIKNNDILNKNISLNNVNYSHKIIFIKAFSCGAEYILNKLK
jgi:hypothetical protein